MSKKASKIQVGDVISFNYNKGFYMKLITIFNYIKFKASYATHTGIVTSVYGNKINVKEVIFDPNKNDFDIHEYTEDYLLNNKYVTVLRSLIKLNNVKKNSCKYNSAVYDFVSILLMPFKISFNSKKAVFCSEVVTRILYDSSNKKLNIAKEYEINYEKVSPMHIYLSGFFKIIKK